MAGVKAKTDLCIANWQSGRRTLSSGDIASEQRVLNHALQELEMVGSAEGTCGRSQ